MSRFKVTLQRKLSSVHQREIVVEAKDVGEAYCKAYFQAFTDQKTSSDGWRMAEEHCGSVGLAKPIVEVAEGK